MYAGIWKASLSRWIDVVVNWSDSLSLHSACIFCENMIHYASCILYIYIYIYTFCLYIYIYIIKYLHTCYCTHSDWDTNGSCKLIIKLDVQYCKHQQFSIAITWFQRGYGTRQLTGRVQCSYGNSIAIDYIVLYFTRDHIFCALAPDTNNSFFLCQYWCHTYLKTVKSGLYTWSACLVWVHGAFVHHLRPFGVFTVCLGVSRTWEHSNMFNNMSVS